MLAIFVMSEIEKINVKLLIKHNFPFYSMGFYSMYQETYLSLLEGSHATAPKAL